MIYYSYVETMDSNYLGHVFTDSLVYKTVFSGVIVFVLYYVANRLNKTLPKLNCLQRPCLFDLITELLRR